MRSSVPVASNDDALVNQVDVEQATVHAPPAVLAEDHEQMVVALAVEDGLALNLTMGVGHEGVIP